MRAVRVSHVRLPSGGQAEPCPHDAVAVTGRLGPPVIRAGESLDDVEPVGSVASGLAVPRAAEVFALDPYVVGVDLDADGEELALAVGMGDRVGGELAGDQDGIGGGGAAVQVGGDLAAYPRYLVGPAAERAATVSMVALRFHSLRGDALSRGASRDLIEGVIRERWPGTAS